jgi:dethiobiotin synthetase
MRTLFVTATGTEIGKTFVTTLLVAELRAAGQSVRALKPLATGFDPARVATSDTGLLLAAQGMAASAANIERITPWRFTLPLSPDMAAARERREIGFDDLVTFCRREQDADYTLIEGIGGVMTPLDERHTVLDWIAALDAPALLVTGSYLGTLSHTLTALGMLRHRGVRLAGIVVSESLEQPVAAAETVRELERFAAPTPVALVRREGADRPTTANLSALLAAAR